ncbi:MAG: hypothetical protein K6G48_02655 [Acholeplasmatales bacterium]|nr:hypothetical protein [Acholeplasmatales bacterium]
MTEEGLLDKLGFIELYNDIKEAIAEEIRIYDELSYRVIDFTKEANSYFLERINTPDFYYLVLKIKKELGMEIIYIYSSKSLRIYREYGHRISEEEGYRFSSNEKPYKI